MQFFSLTQIDLRHQIYSVEIGSNDFGWNVHIQTHTNQMPLLRGSYSYFIAVGLQKEKRWIKEKKLPLNEKVFKILNNLWMCFFYVSVIIHNVRNTHWYKNTHTGYFKSMCFLPHSQCDRTEWSVAPGASWRCLLPDYLERRGKLGGADT